MPKPQLMALPQPRRRSVRQRIRLVKFERLATVDRGELPLLQATAHAGVSHQAWRLGFGEVVVRLVAAAARTDSHGFLHSTDFLAGFALYIAI